MAPAATREPASTPTRRARAHATRTTAAGSSRRPRGSAPRPPGPALACGGTHLGTPHSLGPVAGGLASGLAADPESAARQYLADSPELFGLDADAVADLETLLVRPIGAGAVVLLRQRFGRAARRPTTGWSRFSSATAPCCTSARRCRRTRARPRAATLSAADVDHGRDSRDAGLTADQVSRSDSRLVAVPTPAQGPRAAYEVTLVSTQGEVPTAFTTYVDARTGDVLVREDLVDFDSDNPRWAVFPATPGRRRRPLATRESGARPWLPAASALSATR